MRSCFSIRDRLSLIEMSFGCAWSPTSTWITLFLVRGSRCSKHFFHWRFSCWAHGSVYNGSMSLSYCAWLIDVMLVKSFLKTTLTLKSETQLDEAEDYDGGDSSDSNSNQEMAWHIQSPRCTVVIVSWFFFWYERLQRDAPLFTKIQAISTIQAVSHSFHHVMCWQRIMKELWVFQVVIWFFGCRGLSLASA